MDGFTDTIQRGPAAKDARPALIEAAVGADAGTRWSALEALPKLAPAPELVLPVYRTAVTGESWQKAADGVVRLGAASALTLASLLKHDHAVVRWRAAGVSARLGPQGRTATPDLIEALPHLVAALKNLFPGLGSALTASQPHLQEPSLLR